MYTPSLKKQKPDNWRRVDTTPPPLPQKKKNSNKTPTSNVTKGTYLQLVTLR